MKKHLYIYIFLLGTLLLHTGSICGQSISATYTATESFCFDDGTLTFTSSGGIAPYTLSLLSGPSDPNIAYPITLSPGITTFSGLPHGGYSVSITDATGASVLDSATVPGSYQFPSLTYSFLSGSTILATESGGHAPFQYTISSTGSNIGFGPYQSSDTFTGLCPGNYWIRVSDSCGNIYTNEITFSNAITATINCINFSKGTLTATASLGTPPYTYSTNGMTNTTGVFTGLPPYFSGNLTVTDACGTSYASFISAPFVSLTEKCPPDSIIYLSGIQYPIHPTTFTFTCTNCIPPQTVTVPYTPPLGVIPLFSHQPPSSGYNIIAVSSACGGDTFMPVHPMITNNVVITTQYISCRSFKTTVSNLGVPVAVDSFVLSYTTYGPAIESNTTGVFSQLPDSLYIVTAYIGSLCGDTPRTDVTIPYFYGGCFTLMKDSTCHSAWEYSTNSILPELYSLVSAAGDTTPSSPGLALNANFYNLPSNASYTLISDSGCQKALESPPDVVPAFDVVAYLPCVGQPVIQFTGSAFAYCGTVATGSDISIRISYGDSLIYSNNGSYSTSPAITAISQSGYYHYTIYAANFDDTSSMLRYDTVCPIDTGTVFLDNVQIPYLLSNIGLICDTSQHMDTIFYHVFGGSAPYTIEVPGYDTTIIQTNTGIFPAHHTGAYTMIVYDDCGISRSETFNVIDTCSSCPYAAMYPLDTAYCAGDTVRLRSVSIHAVSYQWYLNGDLYSTVPDTFFISSSGGYTIMLRVLSASGCADTAIVHFADGCGGCPIAALPPPHIFCIGDTIPLTDIGFGGAYFLWLINGQPYSVSADTVFVPTVVGTYDILLRVTSATNCVRVADVHIPVQGKYVLTLPADTVYCGAFSEVLRTGIASTVWSTGDTAPQITVTAPGTYTASAADRCGTTIDTVTIAENPIPLVDLGDDTTICIGTTLTLNAGHPGATYIWQDSTMMQTYTVSTAGTYAVSVTVLGCTGSNSIVISYLSPPAPFSLGTDTIYCGGFIRVLDATTLYATTTTWSTGATGPQLTVDTGGTYTAVAANKCGSATSSITFIEKPVPVVNLGNDTGLCENQTVILNAGNPGDTYIWDDGATSATITVTTPGTYAVSVTENGCTGADSIKVSYIAAPVAFSVGGDTTFCSGGRLLLEAYQPNVYSVWNTGSTSSYIYVEQSGEYIVLDSNKCGMATDSISVTVENCSCKAIIPTAFSPNGDGVNDTYGAYAPCVPTNFLLEIFDRWGQKLFSSTIITDRWDGKYKNYGQPLGVYAYTMRYTDPYTNLSYFQSGNVTLLR